MRKPIRRFSRLNTLRTMSSEIDKQKLAGDPKNRDGIRTHFQAGTSRLRKRLKELKDDLKKIRHQVHEKEMKIDQLNKVLLQQTANMVVLADKLNCVTGELAVAKSSAIEQSRTLAQEVTDRDSTIDCLCKTIEDLKTRVVCLATPSLGIRVAALERDFAFLQQKTAGSIAGGRTTPPSSPS